jgi:hypothetical protein
VGSWDAQTLQRPILLRLITSDFYPPPPPPICYSTACPEPERTAKEIRPSANHTSFGSGRFLAEKTLLAGH